MNNRLKIILKHIETGIGVIDVGTDHGYLPIALAENGYSGKIIASDVNQEPLNKARANAIRSGCADRIDFRLADGLAGCIPDEVDMIVIAGMGGDTICNILDSAEWCMSREYKLILQPMTKAEVLRYWLSNNGFAFKYEERVKENGTIYQIIVAVYDENSYLNDAELFMGKYELVKDSLYFNEELDIYFRRLKKAAEGMKHAPGRQALYGIYTNMVNELEEMRKNHDNG